jgi:hypothetical protein
MLEIPSGTTSSVLISDFVGNFTNAPEKGHPERDLSREHLISSLAEGTRSDPALRNLIQSL